MPADVPKPHVAQPFWSGHPEDNGTGLYLRGLPEHVETNRLPEPPKGTDEWKASIRVWRMPPGAKRGHERSRFFDGMAVAMAMQWDGPAGYSLESDASKPAYSLLGEFE
jgi:hypothetical protein